MPGPRNCRDLPEPAWGVLVRPAWLLGQGEGGKTLPPCPPGILKIRGRRLSDCKPSAPLNPGQTSSKRGQLSPLQACLKSLENSVHGWKCWAPSVPGVESEGVTSVIYNTFSWSSRGSRVLRTADHLLQSSPAPRCLGTCPHRQGPHLSPCPVSALSSLPSVPSVSSLWS